MTARAINRRGACPALSAPMQTGDGLLVRLQPAAQGLTPWQLAGLSESAARHGNGLIEITARGSIQIRGLTARSATELAADVNALEIDVRTGVPVEIGPLAGLDPEEIADPRPLADAIRVAISDAGLAQRLGPKVSVVVDGGGRFDLKSVSADIRLQAFERRGRLIWRLALAGDAHTAEPLGATSADGAVGFVVDLLSEIADRGIGGRGRDLLLREHDDRRSTLPPSVLPDCLARATGLGPSCGPPAKGEIGSFGDRRNPCGRPISPLAGGPQDGPRPVARARQSGKTEGGNVERKAGQPHPIPLGLHPLSNGQTALVLALPFGSVHAPDLAAFSQTALDLGIAELRPAPGRTLIALSRTSNAAGALKNQVRAFGLVIEPTDSRLGISACAGKPACASGHLATRALAAQLAIEQPDLVGQVKHIHVSGCAKGCAHPAPAALTLVGGENGVGLVVNGTARQKPLAYTRPEALVVGLQRLARLMREEQAVGSDGDQILSRIGEDRLAAAFRQDV